MLSGGERALTAVALLFAMLEVRPVPFCVLDEVDAALDEANVGRFTEALRGLAATTQFVVITHNRGTIEAADALYGVTVGEDSVSRVISLRLDEATALATGGRATLVSRSSPPPADGPHEVRALFWRRKPRKRPPRPRSRRRRRPHRLPRRTLRPGRWPAPTRPPSHAGRGDRCWNGRRRLTTRPSWPRASRRRAAGSCRGCAASSASAALAGRLGRGRGDADRRRRRRGAGDGRRGAGPQAARHGHSDGGGRIGARGASRAARTGWRDAPARPRPTPGWRPTGAWHGLALNRAGGDHTRACADGVRRGRRPGPGQGYHLRRLR